MSTGASPAALQSRSRLGFRAMLNLPALPYEVRCPMHGSIPFTELERRIINHPFVQRLRAITQLGFADLVYPGASHNRFSHSLGVMHLAGRVYEQVLNTAWSDLAQGFTADELEYLWKIIRLAGLLHDLGHAPFSHSFEPLLPKRGALPLPRTWYDSFDANAQATHEDYSVATIYRMSQESDALISEEEAQDICALVTGRIRPTARLQHGSTASSIYPLLQQIIAGEIDADRMDYLRRDAHFAGVTYGHFDLERLVSSLTCLSVPNGLTMALDQNAVFTYENFLMARFHMAMQVYYHKTLPSFERFVRNAVEEEEIPFQMDGSLENFLEAREDLLKAQIYGARNKRWCGRIVRREPFSRLMGQNDLAQPGVRDTALQVLKDADIETIHMREERRLSTMDTEVEGAPTTVYVLERRLGEAVPRPLREVSTLLQRYDQRFAVENLYCAPEDFPRAVKLLKQALGRT